MSSGTSDTGPWMPVRRVISDPGWDDPYDAHGYLVATRYKPDPDSGIPYNIHLFQMNASGNSINPASDTVIHQSRGSEANKLYKIRGLYFHFFSAAHAEGRIPMTERASSLKGAWETRQLMHVNRWVDKEQIRPVVFCHAPRNRRLGRARRRPASSPLDIGLAHPRGYRRGRHRKHALDGACPSSAGSQHRPWDER
jgi:hypothetical protein